MQVLVFLVLEFASAVPLKIDWLPGCRERGAKALEERLVLKKAESSAATEVPAAAAAVAAAAEKGSSAVPAAGDADVEAAAA